MVDETEYSMTLNRLQRAALIVGLVAIGMQTTAWVSTPGGFLVYPHFIATLWWLVGEWVATAAFTIAAMVLVGTRWNQRKKSA